MPPNFESPLKIDSSGHVLPTGPLDMPKGETVNRVSAWVYQLKADGTGAVCIAAQTAGFNPSDTKWTGNSATAFHQGQFQPGQATGLALAISTDSSGATKVFWWGETILVQL
jgi:hypothetical protein